MYSKEPRNKTLALEDAILAIQVAITLGAEIVAPIGVSFFEASVHWSKNEQGDPVTPMNVGYYQTEVDALSAMCDNIISNYSDEWLGPWMPVFYDDTQESMSWDTYVILRQEYLTSHSNEELITYYFGKEGGYEIKKVKIEGKS